MVRLLLAALGILLLLVGCSSPPEADKALGKGAKVLVRSKYGSGSAMLGILPSGDWVVAAIPDKGEVSRQVVAVRQDRPAPVVMAGITAVVGKAPAGADRYELLTDTRMVLKGKVENGVYLVVWATQRQEPAFVLRILDEKGNELMLWPPPGGLPAA